MSREQARHVLVKAKVLEWALALQLGVDHVDLRHANVGLDSQEGDVTYRKVQKLDNCDLESTSSTFFSANQEVGISTSGVNDGRRQLQIEMLELFGSMKQSHSFLKDLDDVFVVANVAGEDGRALGVESRVFQFIDFIACGQDHGRVLPGHDQVAVASGQFRVPHHRPDVL